MRLYTQGLHAVGGKAVTKKGLHSQSRRCWVLPAFLTLYRDPTPLRCQTFHQLPKYVQVDEYVLFLGV
jgi:hypothetical protein